ncbi:MAG TPA: hypothetical protein VLK82_25780 [Candidatus Tectomicrobia bacterium]|nr:hypothetical protein [Candidatus Tectomicrobia bacterium]
MQRSMAANIWFAWLQFLVGSRRWQALRERRFSRVPRQILPAELAELYVILIIAAPLMQEFIVTPFLE